MGIELKNTLPDPLKKGVRSFAATLKHNLEAALKDVGKAVHTRVRQPIKRHPGESSLYNSIKLDQSGLKAMSVSIQTNNPIAIFRELDTRAHEIRAHGKALAFFKRGKLILVKAVQHPGTRGTHSWQHGASKMRMILPMAYKFATDAAIEGLKYAKRYS